MWRVTVVLGTLSLLAVLSIFCSVILSELYPSLQPSNVENDDDNTAAIPTRVVTMSPQLPSNSSKDAPLVTSLVAVNKNDKSKQPEETDTQDYSSGSGIITGRRTGSISEPFQARIIDVTCPSLSPVPDQQDLASWQVLEQNVSWVYYTAHRDPRDSGSRHVYVHVTGILLTESLFNASRNTLFCQLWHDNGRLLQVSMATARGIIDRNMRYTYENFILVCPFDTNLYQPGKTYVSVVPQPCEQPLNALSIHDNQDESGDVLPRVRFSVCLCGSMRKNYSDHQRFIEWMELNSIFGVQRTFVYTTDTAPHLQAVFKYYSIKGNLVSIDWHPPYVYVRKYAHLAMVHDCLMRNMMTSDYVAFIDVDETITPRRRDVFTWDEMIKEAGCDGKSYISVPNTLFHPDWSDDPEFANDTLVAKRLRLYTLLKTKREEDFMGFEERSKNIMRPENVDHIKLHKVFLKKEIHEEPCVLDPEIGALHHYRWLYTRIQEGHAPEPHWIQDRTLHKYSRDLISRTKAVFDELKEYLPET